MAQEERAAVGKAWQGSWRTTQVGLCLLRIPCWLTWMTPESSRGAWALEDVFLEQQGQAGEDGSTHCWV